MYRSFFPSPLHHPLGHLSPDRKQYLVNSLYKNPHLKWALHNPHGLHVDIGPDYAQRWLFSWEEILTLCTPDMSVYKLIDLSTPPVWLCWPHGKQLFVRTREELTHQPAGYGPTPEGPWPAGFEGPWEWKEPTTGPFAPSPYGSYAPGGPQAVYAKHPVVYHGRAIFVGALFLLEDSFNDEDLLSKGIVREVKPHDYAHTRDHELTHWWFMNKPLREDYAQRYETGDLTGIQWIVHPPPDTASIAETAEVPSDAQPAVGQQLDSDFPERGRPPNHTREGYHKTYIDLYTKNGKKHPTNAQLVAVLKVSESTVKGYKRRYGFPVLPK